MAAFLPFLPAAITAAGSIAGGYLSGRGKKQKETPIQKRQRRLIDELIRSIGGQGQFSNLFNKNEEDFQKSFVEPAKARFRNQISPQIQQQAIASGQQYSSGLDDQLLRAGVDLDQMLNESYMQYKQGGENNMIAAINAILNQSGGLPYQPSSGQDIMSSASGLLASPEFSETLSNAFSTPSSGASPAQGIASQPMSGMPSPQVSARPGFKPDYLQYPLGDKRWNNQYY